MSSVRTSACDIPVLLSVTVKFIDCAKRTQPQNTKRWKTEPRCYSLRHLRGAETDIWNVERTNNNDVEERSIGEESTVQICFDFTKGRCSRRNCKFSHDFDAIVRYNSKEQGICFDFLRGECNRGPLCRFSHDLTNVMKQWATELRGGGQARPLCGICYDFVRGQCPRGKKCRFSHDLREIALTTSRQQTEATHNRQQHPWDRNGQLRSRSSVDSNDSHRSTDANNENRSIWNPPTALINLKVIIPPTREVTKPKEKRGSPAALCNIRARQLLGRDLCQELGIPILNSSLSVGR